MSANRNDALLSDREIAALRAQASQLRSSMIASHKLDSREAGWLPTSAMGSGMDYAESRLYQQGDEPRSINWRLSARSSETYVKTYHMESRPSLWVVLDYRRSMVFGTRSRLKMTQALRLSTMLAFAAEQHRLNLKVLLLTDSEECLEAQNVDALLSVINHSPSTPVIDSGAITQVAFGDVFNHLEQRLEKGSLVYLISDFIDLKENHQKRMFQLQDQHFVQALHVIDPAEQKLSKTGGVSLQNLFSNSFLTLKASDRNRETRLNNALKDHSARIKAILLKSAVHYASISTDEENLHTEIIFPLGH